MNSFTAIDLAKLPPPQAIQVLDAETIISQTVAKLIADHPEYAQVITLESEPFRINIEQLAYRETVWRGHLNDLVKANLLAFASGATLDHIAARFNVARLIITPANPSAVPPIAEVRESDDRLRRRVQLSFEGFSTAGPFGAYIFHALSADGATADVSVVSPAPNQITVTVLAEAGNGLADQALLDKVITALSDQEVRPIGDIVTVNSAQILNYQILASLILYDGPDGAIVLEAALARLTKYIADRRRLGQDIQRNAIIAALFVEGVQDVVLNEPANSLEVSFAQAGHCTGVNVTIGGRDA